MSVALLRDIRYFGSQYTVPPAGPESLSGDESTDAKSINNPDARNTARNDRAQKAPN